MRFINLGIYKNGHRFDSFGHTPAMRQSKTSAQPAKPSVTPRLSPSRSGCIHIHLLNIVLNIIIQFCLCKFCQLVCIERKSGLVVLT